MKAELALIRERIRTRASQARTLAIWIHRRAPWLPGALAWAGVAGLAALTWAGFRAELGYPWEVFVHLRIQIAFACLLAAGAACALRAPFAALACLALAAPNLSDARDTPPFAPALAEDSPAEITVIWANLHRSSRAADWVVQTAREMGADAVVVTETHPPLHRQIQNALPGHVCHSGPGVDGFTVAVFAAPPCAAPEGMGFSGEIAGVLADGRPILGVHPARPDSAAHLARRDREIAAAVDALPPGGVLMGDLNATPWSPVLRAMPARGLRRVRCSGRFTATWMSRLPMFGLPIDHVYVRDSVAARCTVGPDIGSDHRPLIVEIASGG